MIVHKDTTLNQQILCVYYISIKPLNVNWYRIGNKV